jgi:hypothetical protein
MFVSGFEPYGIFLLFFIIIVRYLHEVAIDDIRHETINVYKSETAVARWRRL